MKSPKIKFNYAQVQAVCPVTVSGPLGKAHLFSPQTAGSGRTRGRWPTPERMRPPREGFVSSRGSRQSTGGPPALSMSRGCSHFSAVWQLLPVRLAEILGSDS